MGVNLIKAVNNFRPGFALVSGAAADTNIAIAGIKTTDQLICVVESATSTAILTDRTSTSSITSDGNIQCSVATDSDTLLVFWQSGE